jgi:uncharacterized protein (TIGR02001 family)
LQFARSLDIVCASASGEEDLVRRLWLCGLCVALIAGPAFAAQETPGAPKTAVYGSVTVASAYVWRGQVYDDRVVVQPYLEVARNGFLLGVWGNFSTSDTYEASWDFSEVDLSVSYSLQLKAAEIAFGVISYLPISVDQERYHEAFVTAKFPNAWVTPRVAAYRTFDGDHGSYVLGGLSRDFKLTEKLTLGGDVSSGFGSSRYNEYSWGVDGNRMNDGVVSLSLRYALSDAMALAPSLSYSWLWDAKLRDASAEAFPASGSDPALLVGSLTLQYSF